MSITRLLSIILGLSIYLNVDAQSNNNSGKLKLTYVPLSVELANLNTRYNSDDLPENFDVNHYKSITPEFSLSYISPLNIRRFQLGISIGHKSQNIRYDVALKSEFFVNTTLWQYEKEFRYDILYIKPILYRRINDNSALQFGMEIGKAYSIDGFIETFEENTYYFHTVRNAQFEVVHHSQYRIERNNPFDKDNLIQFSSPEIIYYHKVIAGLSIHLGMKLNLGFMGGGRFLHFYKYDFERNESEYLYYANAKKNLIGTVGISYSFRKTVK